jgi:hypothetical protein
MTMSNYGDWMRRAAAFTERLRGLPGEVRVEAVVAPPLSDEAVAALARSCRLPIPDPLRRFWTQASEHCRCTYWWDAPERFHPQMAVAFPDWSLSHIWGGPEFEAAEDLVKLTDDLLDWETRDDFPLDARYWVHSLPIVPVGNGDYAGLYVRDDPVNPPVVYLCHDGCGASGIIAPNFDAFLVLWERLGYIGLHFLRSFVNPRTGLVDPDALPSETEAVGCLLRGEVRSDLVKTPVTVTASEWEACVDPDRMLQWLEAHDLLDQANVRRFACACCRRMWDRLGQWDRRAVEVAEKFAEGSASEAELQSARAALFGGDRSRQLLGEMSVSTSNSDDSVDDAT